MSRLKMLAILSIVTVVAGSAMANNGPPFENNPEQLWQGARESGVRVYIDSVPAICSTSQNTPESAALMNVLLHLNARPVEPWPWFCEQGMDALEDDLDEWFDGQELGEEPDAIGLLFMEKIGDIAGYMRESMLGIDDQSYYPPPILDLNEWVQTAEMSGETFDKILRYPSRGVIQSHNIGSGDIKEAIETLARQVAFEVDVDVEEEADFARFQAAIDRNMPVVLKFDDHFMTGVGYWLDEEDNQYLIVHHPATSEFKVVVEEDWDAMRAYPEDFIGAGEEDIIPGCQFILWQESMEFYLLEIMSWERIFDQIWEEAEGEV